MRAHCVCLHCAVAVSTLEQLTKSNKMESETFKICTFNCNGLGNNTKRRDVFDYLRKKKCNIYFLQETHWKSLSENYVRAAWGYNVWLSGRETNKNGVAILFNNNFEYMLHNVVKDLEGCYVAMDVEILKKRMTLMNVYGPSSGDRPDFLDEVCRIIEQFGNEHVVVAGDWNCVLDMKLDVRNYNSIVNRPRTRTKLLEIMATYDLFDVARELYPEKKMYTWRKFNSVKQARLDYFLISEELMTETKAITVDPSYRSDHSFVILQINKKQFKRDRPFWKHNCSLLKDKEYVKQIKQVFSAVKAQYALPIYNDENVHNVPNKEIVFVINDQLFFETLLMEARGKTIAYASYKKKKEIEKERQLEENLQRLDADVTEIVLPEIERVKAELQEIRDKRMEGVTIRSRVKWINEGEKVSKYFCNLESRNYLDKAMHFVENSNGDIVSEQGNILQEVKQFYEELYRQRQVEDIDLKANLKECPVLSENDREQIEGPITFAEAIKALKNMKNNKSPGPDGFTVEFFKFFFVDIGDFFVRSINYGFEHEQMSVTQRQGVITCIPKEGKPKRFLKNWRPISLLNVTYKIASACIANRIKNVLPTIVHEDQKGFLKGRYIGDNIRLLYDLLVYTEKENIPGLLLMIDFEKAFDSVSWSFLHKALEFFNFGPDLRKWIKLFYNGINSCVSVNGQYSTWFSIARGVRQGDPSSPYLYLICAEILSLMIRQNENIKGIKINAKDCLLTQFADDTSLCLDGSKKSFEEAIQTLTKFSEFSGLKMNTEKTQVVWIGSRKNCNVKYMQDRNFVWDPGIFKILGVKLTTDVNTISQINFEDKLLSIQRVLKSWKRRQISPLGRITVIKALIISRLTHLLINLPDPSDQFISSLEKELYNYLWEGKISKIKKAVICKSYSEGGLQMLDIRAFLSTLKVSWLKRLRKESDWRDFTLNMFPYFADIDTLGCEYANTIMKRTSNLFWKDVLRHYKKISSKCTVSTIDEFMADCIHYNINILRDRKVVYVKEWCEAGILWIRHLVNLDGTFMNFQQFRLRYPTIMRTNYLMYEGILNAVKLYRQRIDVNLTNTFKNFHSKVWFCIGKGNKFIQSMLLRSGATPTAITRWNENYDDLCWPKIFTMCIKTTVDVQLRWFQLRILHRILPTEKYLHRCKIVESPLCNFCLHEPETLDHLFWKCEFTKQFWEALVVLIQEKCVHVHNLHFDEKLILFGISDQVRTDKGLDLLIVWSKFFIYKAKLSKTRPRIQTFLQTLKFRWNIEKYRSIVNGLQAKFNEIWMPYLPLLDHIN